MKGWTTLRRVENHGAELYQGKEGGGRPWGPKEHNISQQSIQEAGKATSSRGEKVHNDYN